MIDSTSGEELPDVPGVPDVDSERISEEEFRSKKPRIQLRLHHFFALTAAMAVLLTARGPQQFGESPQMPPVAVTIQAAFSVLYQIPAAIAIAALGYGIAAYRRGELFFNQPGHWLLVEISLMSLLWLPMAILFRFLPIHYSNTPPGDSAFVWMFVFGGYSLLVFFLGRILINVYLGRRKCSQSRWKRVFYLKAASTVLPFIGEVLVLGFLIIAMRTDRQERLLRNASHRCGVYVQLAQSLLTVAGGTVGMVGMVMFFLMR